jgi:hypothetical protein
MPVGNKIPELVLDYILKKNDHLYSWPFFKLTVRIHPKIRFNIVDLAGTGAP